MRAGSAGTTTGPALHVDAFLLAGHFSGAGHADTLRIAVGYAQAAERAGFDGVRSSAIAMAGFILGRTGRLRIGTAAANLSYHHPVALAEEAALLDAVSGVGRPRRSPRRPVVRPRGVGRRIGPLHPGRLRRGTRLGPCGAQRRPQRTSRNIERLDAQVIPPFRRLRRTP